MNAELKPHEKAVPTGYRLNASGHLVPEELVRESDKLRDELVQKLVQAARVMREDLAQMKQDTQGEILAFVDLMAQDYQAKLGGAKGNIKLTSYDGREAVEINVNAIKGFDEKIHVAKGLIDECIKEWGAGARPEVVMLLNQAFQTDSQGKLNHARIYDLMRLDIDHPIWREAMRALKDSIQVYGSKSYIRFYERTAPDKKFEQISLDLASA